MRQSTTHEATALVTQCREALEHVTFHDMATRQLFETLIDHTNHLAMSQTAQALAEQKIL